MNLWIPILTFLVFCGISFLVSKFRLPKKNTDHYDEALKKSLNMSHSEFAEFRRKINSNPEYLGKK